VVRPAEICDYLNVIKAEANRATTIIKQLRLLTERRPQAKYGFCLTEACSDCITRLAALAETKLVRVRLRVSTPQTYVTGVKELLEIALYNLLINSVTALDNPAILYRRLTVRIIAKPPGNTAIQVFDNGCGLPDEISDRIFEPFVTGRPEGSGIGLAIAGDIIRWHRGQLNCLPRKHGTCMEIVLPLD
jgi:signal transduction histidine kinase